MICKLQQIIISDITVFRPAYYYLFATRVFPLFYASWINLSYSKTTLIFSSLFVSSPSRKSLSLSLLNVAILTKGISAHTQKKCIRSHVIECLQYIGNVFKFILKLGNKHMHNYNLTLPFSYGYHRHITAEVTSFFTLSPHTPI